MGVAGGARTEEKRAEGDRRIRQGAQEWCSLHTERHIYTNRKMRYVHCRRRPASDDGFIKD